jgi:DNA primase
MIILVEGYFDHARFTDAGFECVVATCGTALTSPQARQMGALASVFICYDGDRSGQKASVRAAEVILEQGYLPGIIAIPGGQDPDDYILEMGRESVLELISAADDPIRYALGLLGGWSSVKGSERKVKVVKRLVEIASSATEPVIRETMIREISEQTGYSMRTLELEIEEGESKKRKPTQWKLNEMELNTWDSRILGSILLSPHGLADPLIELVEESDFRSESGSRILREIKKQVSSGKDNFQPSLLEDNDRIACTRLLVDYPEQTGGTDIDRLMKTVKKDRLHRERKLLKSQLNSEESEGRQELQRKIIEIEIKLINM